MSRSATRWLVILFFATRFLIWIFRPTVFTEIIYSYMPYAHLWASGVQAYLQQLYEYPPGTIPLLYLPYLVDKLSFGQPWHLNYLEAYRASILLVDIGLFFYVWRTLVRTQKNQRMRLTSLLYLIAVTTKAHHFIYDSLDWVFAALLLIAATAPTTLGERWGLVAGWLAYWAGIAVKLINAPLGAIYLFLEKKSWRRSILVAASTFLLIWAWPLLKFRSSLQVMLVFHQQRGLQIDSFGAIIGRIINQFSHTEHVAELYKNYELVGPVSSAILTILGILFPLSLVLFLLYGLHSINRSRKQNPFLLRLNLTLGYVLVFMIFGKVLSTPFLLWHIPLLAVYPFQNWKQQLGWLLSSALLVLITMTPLPFGQWGIVHLPIWIHMVKALILLGWLRIVLPGVKSP